MLAVNSLRFTVHVLDMAPAALKERPCVVAMAISTARVPCYISTGGMLNHALFSLWEVRKADILEESLRVFAGDFKLSSDSIDSSLCRKAVTIYRIGLTQ